MGDPKSGGGRKALISYAHDDGAKIAAQVRKRLTDEAPDIDIWQDIAHEEAGEGWWGQIADAIEHSDYLILIMTDGAGQSEIVQREFVHARQEGTCICPIYSKSAQNLDFGNLPQWMNKLHAYNIDTHWEQLVAHLRSPCQVTRVPFMAPAMPEGFVERPTEFGSLRDLLLEKGSKNAVAITTALHGAGGFGKTTLAAALCHDTGIRFAFDDGILWATLGQEPNLLGALTKLYDALAGGQKRLTDEEAAASALADKLKNKDCLVVLDDVWDPTHLTHLLRGIKGCACLITTRLSEVAKEAQRVDVDEMSADEATEMMIKRLTPRPDDLKPFEDLAQRMGEWPLLIELARGVLVRLVNLGQTIEKALQYLNEALDKRGVKAFDRKNSTDRNYAAAASIEISIDLLKPGEREKYLELSIFPEDIDIPLSVVGDLWDSGDFETDEILLRLADLSLLKLNLGSDTIRLHDVMRKYAGESLQDAAAVHARLVERWGDLHDLPNDYAWRWVAYHLHHGGRNESLRELLLDFDWISAKLYAIDVVDLVHDYDNLPDDPALTLVQSALRLSAHILSDDKTQLPEQLYGRLMSRDDPEILELIEQAANSKAVWLRPLTPAMTQAGGAEIRTLEGHTSGVIAVAVTDDGKKAISASGDKSLKVWNIETGAEIRTLIGHTDWVLAVAVTDDGKKAISASEDETLKVWDIETGEDIRTLKGHTSAVSAVAVTDDGKKAISASWDETLKVWDIETGAEIRTLRGHTDWVRAVAVTDDGKEAISAADDKTLKVWDIETGAEIRTLRGHTSWVRAVAVTDDGKKAISASDDQTLKVWDIETGKEIRTLKGHIDCVSAVAVTESGKKAISASYDGTLKVWDIETGAEIRTLKGHTDWVLAVAVTEGGKKAISASADQTLKVWDIEACAEIRALRGHHTGLVNAVAVTDDGKKAISASNDRTLKVWDTETGAAILTLKRHTDAVYAVAVTDDGKKAISASGDKSLKVWNIETGAEIRTLKGHTDVVNAVAVTGDGKKAISVSWDQTLKVWDIETGARIRTLKGHSSVVSAVAVTDDGKKAISASYDKTLKVWDIEEGEEIHTLKGHSSVIYAVAVTKDGEKAISGSDDETLKVWDIETGAQFRTLKGHALGVLAVAVTDDGKKVISASNDKTLKVWYIETGEVIADFNADENLYCCAIASAGLTIVTAGASGRLHFLRLEEK